MEGSDRYLHGGDDVLPHMGKLKDSSVPRFRQRACPRDHTPLVAEKVAVRGPDVTIDKCPSCGGVFLDKNELLRISGDFRLNKYLRDKVALDSDSQLVCPHCGGIMDLEHIAGAEVEVCLTCFGLWLDKGELAALKDRSNITPIPITSEKRQEIARGEKATKDRRGRLRNPFVSLDRAFGEFARRYL